MLTQKILPQGIKWHMQRILKNYQTPFKPEDNGVALVLKGKKENPESYAQYK